MTAWEDSCSCATCGTGCTGRFSGCQTVWDRGRKDWPDRPTAAAAPQPVSIGVQLAAVAPPPPPPPAVLVPMMDPVLLERMARLEGMTVALIQRDRRRDGELAHADERLELLAAELAALRELLPPPLVERVKELGRQVLASRSIVLR